MPPTRQTAKSGRALPGRFAAPGKLIRAPFLFRDSKPIIVAPVDDFLLFGPRDGLENRAKMLRTVVRGEPDAIITFVGAVRRHPDCFRHVKHIVNLSASTIRSNHTQKVLVHSVDDALRVHASAVAFHINMSSAHANQMIQAASFVISRAERYELPTVGIVYPRGERAGLDEDYAEMKARDPEGYADLIAHCVSLGVDLGFDAIKTYYTDDAKTFRRVVLASDSVPVLIAGGPRVARTVALRRAATAIHAGAAGVSFGRNLFGRKDPISFIGDLRRVGES